MKIDRNLVVAESSPVAASKAVAIGFAFQIVKKSRHHRHQPTAHVYDVIEAAISHNQIKFYFSEEGNPVGYIIWAHLAEDVEARIVEGNSISLHASEWNEGKSVWLLDFVAQAQYLRSIISNLKLDFFRDLDQIRYVRRTSKGLMLCEIQRSGEPKRLHLTKVVI